MEGVNLTPPNPYLYPLLCTFRLTERRITAEESSANLECLQRCESLGNFNADLLTQLSHGCYEELDEGIMREWSSQEQVGFVDGSPRRHPSQQLALSEPVKC